MELQRILLLGNGGREHAFALKLSESKWCEKLFIAPGNAGTQLHGTNVNISVNDFETQAKFCLEKQITLLVVGPEDPLVNGIVNFFKSKNELQHILIVGPSKKGAQLEGSKAFSKAFMQKYQIPTAAYAEFTEPEKAIQYLRNSQAPYVLKADGLAAGKGVIISESLTEAEQSIQEMLGGKFGEASKKVVIEEFLKGIEMSVFVVFDNENYLVLPEAKDYKRIGEGDTGLNTGGMGAISPVAFADENYMQKVHEKIIKPTIEGLKNEKIDYKGFVFIGLIKVGEEPYVIEYNCRMGDPETEAVFPRIESDMVQMCVGIASSNLKNYELKISDKQAATVILVSGGYPEDYEKNKFIQFPENTDQNSIVFHAGTKTENNKILTNGGRVIAITSLDKDLKMALDKSMKIAENISFEGKYFRKDIGKDLMEILQQQATK